MFEQYGLQLALGCAALAIVYGLVTARWIVAQPNGNEKMQQIAAAIQEGAGAYLRRQYQTIAIVGVILFLVIGFLLPGRLAHRDRLRDRRDPVRPGRLHRHVRVGARQRAHRAGRHAGPQRRAQRQLQGRRHHRHARRRPRPARRRRLLHVHPGRRRAERRSAQGRARPDDRPRLRWFADLDLRAPRRRHLHQGRRRRRRPGGQGRSRHPRG